MNKVIFLLATLLMSQLAFSSVICKGVGETGTEIKYVLSDVKGKEINIEYFVSFEGKMEPIINQKATLVAEGYPMFGEKKVIDRTYVLPDNDKSYAIMFYVSADGSASYTARPMEGTANFVASKCTKL